MDAAKVPGVLAVMATAGLYDDSGKWLYHTGLPAKSGVGGGIIAVSPGKFGIAVVSPPLDDAGNSVRAQRAIADDLERARRQSVRTEKVTRDAFMIQSRFLLGLSAQSVQAVLGAATTKRFKAKAVIARQANRRRNFFLSPPAGRAIFSRRQMVTNACCSGLGRVKSSAPPPCCPSDRVTGSAPRRSKTPLCWCGPAWRFAPSRTTIRACSKTRC